MSVADLVLAAGTGDLGKVDHCLQSGVDINALTQDGVSALHAGAFHGRLESVKHLVGKYQAFLNPRDAGGATPVHLACQKGHFEIVKYLIQMGASLLLKDQGGRLPLHYAARGGDASTLKLVMYRPNTDVNEQDAAGETPIYFSAYFGNPECARLLVDAGADVNVANSHGDLPVMWCCFNGHSETLEALLQSGNLNLKCRNSYGWCPLHIAAHMGRIACVEVLLGQAHMDPDSRTEEGHTALHIAVMEDKHECFESLIKGGVDVNSVNKDGHAPLHLVQSAAAARALIEHGAPDLHLRDNAGKTPFEIVVDDEAASVIQEAWEQQAMLYAQEHPEDAQDVHERIEWVAGHNEGAEAGPETQADADAQEDQEPAQVAVANNEVDNDVEEETVDWYATPGNAAVSSVADPRYAYGSDAARSIAGSTGGSSVSGIANVSAVARKEMYTGTTTYRRGPAGASGAGSKAIRSKLPHEEGSNHSAAPPLPHQSSQTSVPQASRPGAVDTSGLPHTTSNTLSPDSGGGKSKIMVTDCDPEGNLFERKTSSSDLSRYDRRPNSAHLRDTAMSASPIGAHMYRGAVYSPESPVIADIQTYEMKGPAQSPDVFDPSKSSINDVRPGPGRPPRHTAGSRSQSRGETRLSHLTATSSYQSLGSPSPPPAPAQSPLMAGRGPTPGSPTASSPQLVVGGPHIPYGKRMIGDTPSPTLGGSPSPQPVAGVSMWEATGGDGTGDRGSVRSR
eukprot:TRINITY_DN742_c0_g1_i1.p1 TRINITY_DN742_c0_g1~~TRINITY_DN742_c0_g1_i1.p1  ORF type:complete len:735 (-),score=88.59 TRINITY_DN742_c0_g1_i1:1496-3700(-)